MNTICLLQLLLEYDLENKNYKVPMRAQLLFFNLYKHLHVYLSYEVLVSCQIMQIQQMLSSREYLIIEHVLLFFPRKTQACAFIYFCKNILPLLFAYTKCNSMKAFPPFNQVFFNFTRFFCLFGATYFILYELAIKELYV